MKKTGIALAAIALAIAALLATSIYPLFKPYPSADYPPAASQAERNLQDLDHLRHLTEVDRSFSSTTTYAFQRTIDDLAARAETLDRAALAIGAARAVALGNNAHTNVRGLAGGRDFNGVPVRVAWFTDGLFVISATPEQRDLLGARILAIDGVPPEQTLDALRAYIGGPANHARELSPNFLVSPELLHAAELSDAPDRMEIETILSDGNSDRRTLMAIAGAPDPTRGNFWPRRDLSPVPDPESRRSGWLHVLSGKAPLYLAEPDRNFRHIYMTDEAVLYIQLNAMRAEGDESLTDYLAGVIAESQQRQIKHAILDLRLNPGGNFLLATDFSRRLPEIVPADGKIIMLVSANTLSAAISTVSRLKYFAGERAILIGEPMGDRAQFWGEGDSVRLPNSQIAVRYATGYHDWENGCGLAEITTCFFLNYFFGTAPGSLAPTLTRAPTFAEFARGEDPVLSEALKLTE